MKRQKETRMEAPKRTTGGLVRRKLFKVRLGKTRSRRTRRG